ncbi:uncharacterized protein LOC132700317 isoform X2 [Cylas formicarius]|uniref:uncharacterized protein LOC132700317 isoform X2 n=1 Tax=Cylas formicarius TaxID=197179 RepID=UPI00295891B3|nr:uncharacterized protein LOC132700317 isoform X2 [Cylas formicarius]
MMGQFTEIFLLTLFFSTSALCVATEEKEPKDKEELVPSETKDGKLEIIKRIKKVNSDGSYTIGYEADDGSFKIESRDVLGNVKGTYGFVDEDGQIKRVSYSSNNASEIFSKPQNPPSELSIIQRTSTATPLVTVKPETHSTTTGHPVTSTSSSVIQSIARRKSTGSTSRPNYQSVENIKSSSKINNVVYSSAAPRVLLQKPAPPSNPQLASKSEGQILRPERFEDEKPVTEEPEIRSNILRRQTHRAPYDAQSHIYNSHQSVGNDVPDVYTSGVTETRPLFTTTARPSRIIPIVSSTTAAPVSVVRPIKYASNYQRNLLHEREPENREYSHETTSTESPVSITNSPVVQIPANRPEHIDQAEPLIALQHPFQGGTILLPFNQFQSRVIPVEDARRKYIIQQQREQQVASEIEIEKQHVKRLNSVQLRPLPVQVDQNGYLREMPQVVTPYSLSAAVPVRMPASSASQHLNNDAENDINDIQPPVSTKDFQKLLNNLIMRQKRLERISELTNPKLHPELYQPPPVVYRRVLQQGPPSYFVGRVPYQQIEPQPQETEASQQRQFVEFPKQYIRQRVYQPEEPDTYRSLYNRQDLDLNGREPRVLRHRDQEEYLPPDVREMLLLKMLQLAMNPALPIDENDENETDSKATISSPQYRRAPVRNVEILGEEVEETPMRNVGRVKRLTGQDYFE